ncbi:uncharacterized protein C8Q71DRAFT_181092 [Rhodofomes roseus]|uniref:Uncharacterized protein n=1 Tax=Rhodofomes roseus TaxID=34475 RepID=A0ABQ8K8J8_9APHY|nr:uncharacterized protein C8Q71DRAFT_181092 [Rhodofomes roseus]KAH9833400.1 hypothetical protein C8Q71DRAFT_181092 [Rhodofomes roseus]
MTSRTMRGDRRIAAWTVCLNFHLEGPGSWPVCSGLVPVLTSKHISQHWNAAWLHCLQQLSLRAAVDNIRGALRRSYTAHSTTSLAHTEPECCLGLRSRSLGAPPSSDSVTAVRTFGRDLAASFRPMTHGSRSSIVLRASACFAVLTQADFEDLCAAAVRRIMRTRAMRRGVPEVFVYNAHQRTGNRSNFFDILNDNVPVLGPSHGNSSGALGTERLLSSLRRGGPERIPVECERQTLRRRRRDGSR